MSYERILAHMNLVVATPQNVDATEFAFENERTNQKRYFEYNKRQKKLLHAFSPTLELSILPQHVILFDHEKHRILYFVRFTLKTIFNHKFVTQEILWRDSQLARDTFKIKNESVSVFVFFNYFLPLAEGVGIATDSMQTHTGKRFWFDRIVQAFDRNLHVYLIDQNTKVKLEVLNFDDFKLKLNDTNTWTDSQAGTGRRAIISRTKLW